MPIRVQTYTGALLAHQPLACRAQIGLIRFPCSAGLATGFLAMSRHFVCYGAHVVGQYLVKLASSSPHLFRYRA